MSTKRKFYVVWEGLAPGIYDSWDECRLQVEGYPGARYKSFNSQTDATNAFRGNPAEHTGLLRAIAAHNATSADAPTVYTPPAGINLDSIAVDGACSRNPGPMEYRGVRVSDGAQLFHFGPLDGGTNNIAEYLALIHAMALLDRQGNTHTVIYSDSRTAMAWVRNGAHKSQLARTPDNARVFELLERADAWLRAHPAHATILKWDTDTLGEIPADFGRK